MLKGNVAEGLGYLRQGFGLIRQPGLRLFVVIPLVLNVLVFALLFGWLAGVFQGLTATFLGWLPDWAWLQAMDWLFWILYGGVVLLFLAYGFVMMANLIGAPFYGYLAELTERRLTGQALDDDGDWRQILRDIPRVMGRELQKLAYYLPRALLLLVLGFIPVVNLVVVVLWFLFNAWMMALQYIDYPADNRKVPFAQVRAVMGRARLTTFGFGLPIALLAMVPVVNLVLMPAAVCGGTAYWVAQRQDARR